MKSDRLRVSVIIPAAGLSKRMSPAPARRGGIKGFAKRKPFILLGRKFILERALNIFKSLKFVKEIIMVVNEKDLAAAEKYFSAGYVKVIKGGKTRSESVSRGIKVVSGGCDIVVIHDGVRPFARKDLAERCITAARKFGAAVAAVPVVSTIKSVDENGFVLSTLERRKLWEIQTPQAFKKDIIARAYCPVPLRYRADNTPMGENITDDAMLVEAMGVPVKIVMGSYDNIKITTPKDLIIAEAILKSR